VYTPDNPKLFSAYTPPSSVSVDAVPVVSAVDLGRIRLYYFARVQATWRILTICKTPFVRPVAFLLKAFSPTTPFRPSSSSQSANLNAARRAFRADFPLVWAGFWVCAYVIVSAFAQIKRLPRLVLCMRRAMRSSLMSPFGIVMTSDRQCAPADGATGRSRQGSGPQRDFSAAKSRSVEVARRRRLMDPMRVAIDLTIRFGSRPSEQRD